MSPAFNANPVAALRCGNAVHDPLGQPSSMQDDHAGRWISDRADQGRKTSRSAELQAAIGMRQRQRALDVAGDRFAGRIRKVVERQDCDVIAHADPAVFTSPSVEAQIGLAFASVQHAHHRLVFKLWTWTCSPFLMSATALPMS